MTVKTVQWNIEMDNRTCKFECVGGSIIREYTGTAKEVMSKIKNRWMNNDCTRFSHEEIIDIIE